jgi:protein Hikeshi
MFGLIVSGRPVITEATTASNTQLAFVIPSTPPFNHLVVFLLPGTAIPEGQCAAVYIQLSPTSEFRLLGALGTEKPTAIFRTRLQGAGASSGFGAVEDDYAMVDDGDPSAAGGVVTVGISLEPIALVEQNLAAAKAVGTTGSEVVRSGGVSAPSVTQTKMLAQKIIGNAFDFLASFGSDVIPLKAFEEWWKKFERRLQDPTFVQRLASGE